MKIPKRKPLCPGFNQALGHCFSGKKENIQNLSDTKIIIRSYSFFSKGSPFHLQSSEKGILDLISELFSSHVYEQEIYIKRIRGRNLPRLSF